MENDLISRSLPVIIVEVSSLMILNIMSLIGNTLVLFSVYKNTRLRTATNLYITALAASDLLSAVFVMPFGTGVLIASKWVFGETFCQLNAFFSLFVIYVSPVTISLTAVNRYVKMCKSSQHYNRLFSARKSRTLIASVWIFVACFVTIPRLTGLQGYEFVPGYAQCSIVHLNKAGKIINYSTVLAFFFIAPLMAIIVSYSKVAKVIQKHNSDASSTLERRRKNKHHTSHEINLSKSLFAVVFAFMICWIPFWNIVILWRFHLVSGMPRNIPLLCRFLLYFSNAINPFIYAGMNPAFKREFHQILCCNRKRKLTLTVVKARLKNSLLERQTSRGTITDLSPVTEGSEIYLNGERKMEEHTMNMLDVVDNDERQVTLI